jgi:solute carrier family 44 (choline transporter-like protein), member 2/4/5
MNPSQTLNTEDPSSKDLGKITSIELQNGPLSSRSCTDLLCLLLFIAFLLTSTAIQLFAWSTGSPQKLLQPYDVDHNGCGLSGTNTQDFPYVYFAAPLSQSAALYTTVCVK